MTKTGFDSEFQKELAVAKSYQEFLQKYLQLRGAKARVSRQAGFASRSYLSEVVAGRKGLSRDSFLRIRGALKIAKPWVELFDRLVWQNEPALRPNNFSHTGNEKALQILRRNLESQQLLRQGKGVDSAGKCLHTPELFQVYAALGNEERGAAVTEIAERTHLKPAVIQRYLNKLLNLELIVQRDDKFFALVNKADALKIQDAQVLETMVAKVCNNLQKNRTQIVKDRNSLLLYAAFSLSSRQIQKFRERFLEVLYETMDEYQDDDGDRVQQLFVSFHGNPMGEE